KGGPRRSFQRVHHNQGNNAQKDDNDGEHGKLRDDPAALAYLFARHLAERFPVAANGTKENHKVLDATSESCARNQPKRAGEIPKLRSQRGADQRARPCDRREMVAEEDPFVGRHKVTAVVVTFRGSSTSVV